MINLDDVISIIGGKIHVWLVQIDSLGGETIVVAASRLLISAAPEYRMLDPDLVPTSFLQAAVCRPFACLTTKVLIDVW